MTATDPELCRVDEGDAIGWLAGLPDDCADLLLCSPPYEAARAYGIDFKLQGQPWVDWMVAVVEAAAPKVTGLIAVVCEGRTKAFRYSAAPVLLMADLHRKGFRLRKPPAYRRVGIPGSGGPDWFRNDYEFVVCVTRGRLPHSDNTACGRPPKYAPGGAMSHQTREGRVGDRRRKPKHEHFGDDARRGLKGAHARDIVARPQPEAFMGYDPPAIANPGNVVERLYTAQEVAALLARRTGERGNVVDCKVGGGLMGHPLAADNEAPFPLTLAEFFVKSCSAPGDLVLDCFAGSCTTGHAARLHGRRFWGCDLRPSQVELGRRRLASVTPHLEGFS